MVYLVIRKIEREFEQRARIGSRVAGHSLRVEECMGRRVTDQPFPFFFWTVIWLRVEDGINEINYHIFKENADYLLGISSLGTQSFTFSFTIIYSWHIQISYCDVWASPETPTTLKMSFCSLSYLTTRVLLILQYEYFFTHTCERFGQFCKGLWSSSPSN